MRAIGITLTSDTAELHGRWLKAQVGVREYDGNQYDEIKSFDESFEPRGLSTVPNESFPKALAKWHRTQQKQKPAAPAPADVEPELDDDIPF